MPDLTTAETVAERIEAEVRTAMACVTKARGWDSAKVWAEDVAEVDRLLDAWLALTG